MSDVIRFEVVCLIRTTWLLFLDWVVNFEPSKLEKVAFWYHSLGKKLFWPTLCSWSDIILRVSSSPIHRLPPYQQHNAAHQSQQSAKRGRGSKRRPRLDSAVPGKLAATWHESHNRTTSGRVGEASSNLVRDVSSCELVLVEVRSLAFHP